MAGGVVCASRGRGRFLLFLHVKGFPCLFRLLKTIKAIILSNMGQAFWGADLGVTQNFPRAWQEGGVIDVWEVLTIQLSMCCHKQGCQGQDKGGVGWDRGCRAGSWGFILKGYMDCLLQQFISDQGWQVGMSPTTVPLDSYSVHELHFIVKDIKVQWIQSLFEHYTARMGYS